MSSNKLPPNLMPALYSHRIHDIVTAARGCGYCIAVHGSMQRDLDLVAIPWVARATSPRWLVKQLCVELGCTVEVRAQGNTVTRMPAWPRRVHAADGRRVLHGSVLAQFDNSN